MAHPGTASAASGATILTSGQVAEASPFGSGGQSATPADGRLRGPDFSARVTAVAWPQTVSSSSPGTLYVAGTGRRLLAFSLSVTQASADAGLGNAPTGVSATLKIGAATLPISMSAIDQQIAGGSSGTAQTTGIDSFVASVPSRAHDVAVTLSEGGFSQTMNLWTLARIAPSPVILYRDPTSPTVSGSAAGPFHLSFTNPADGFSSSDDAQIHSATLGYFSPGASPSTPGDPAQAFLTLEIQSSFPSVPNGQPNQGHFFSGFTPLSGSQLIFTPSGGSAVPATADTADFSSTNAATDDDGIFDAIYRFTVPATTIGGTLSVQAGTASGTEYTGFTGSGGATPITISAPATVALSFPAVPAAPPAQRKPPWVGAPLPATGLAAAGISDSAGPSGSSGSSGGGGFPLWAGVLALLVLVALGVGLDQWRRRNRPAFATVAPDVAAAESSRAPEATDLSATGARPPRASERARFRVDVAGTLRSAGWLEKPESDQLREIACFLALQERAVTLDEIALALWPVGGKRDEPSRETLHTYMSRLRKALGRDRLPEAGAGRGYRLLDTETDWGIISALCARAETVGLTEAMALRRQALSLVRGVPFAGVPSGQYGWAFESGLADRMVVAITRCAHLLAEQCTAAGDHEAARAALEQGLLASPSEEQLLGDLWHLARSSGDASEQRRVRARIAAGLGTDAADRISGP